jgi:hypothetical protein
MKSIVAWTRRSLCRLATTLGIFCLIELVFRLLEGTKPNYQFPWGHDDESVAGFGVIFLAIGYFTRSRLQPTTAPAAPKSPERPHP